MAKELTFSKSKKKKRWKVGQKMWRERVETASFVLKAAAAALPLYILVAESKIRTVFGEFTRKGNTTADLLLWLVCLGQMPN